jgi:hypothetical protein
MSNNSNIVCLVILTPVPYASTVPTDTHLYAAAAAAAAKCCLRAQRSTTSTRPRGHAATQPRNEERRYSAT